MKFERAIGLTELQKKSLIAKELERVKIEVRVKKQMEKEQFKAQEANATEENLKFYF